MSDVKPWYKSKAMWGVIITVLGVLADQPQVLEQVLGVEVAAKLTIVIGLVLTTYGRVRATQRIG